MARRLLALAALIGLSQQQTTGKTVLANCGCGGTTLANQPNNGYETSLAVSAAYCPTSTFPTCNSTSLVETACTLTCPYSRASIAYRNSSAIWLTTDSITCENGVLTNGAGAKITMLQRPTCAFMSPCDKCTSLTQETTKCPSGSTCNTANYVRAIDTDGCDRISCANSATLTLYDAAKNVVPFTTQKLYCTVANKWQNYSNNGNLAGGTTTPNTTTSVNCILPKSCETCAIPAFIEAAAQLPEAFRTGYTRVTPTVNRVDGQCSTVTCPNGYTFMGFVGTAAGQSGQNWTSQNFMKCAANGQWNNGGFGYTPQDMKATCMLKESPCPPVDVVAGNVFAVNCDAQTKVSTMSCAAAMKLTMRYSNGTTSAKYDRATFFPGKGWLAHGCDATAALFTTATGNFITASCGY